MREAVAGGDLAAVSAAGHALKGSSSNIGAQPVAALAADLERAADEGQLDAVAEIVDRLEVALERTIVALRSASVPDAPA